MSAWEAVSRHSSRYDVSGAWFAMAVSCSVCPFVVVFFLFGLFWGRSNPWGALFAPAGHYDAPHVTLLSHPYGLYRCGLFPSSSVFVVFF